MVTERPNQGFQAKGKSMGHLLAATSGGGAGVLIILYIVIYVVFALGVWGSYKKAGPLGEPAWSAFVPIYQFIVLLRIAGRPASWAWFLLLVFIPFVGSIGLLVVSIIVLNDVSKSFGHGPGFTVGLVLLSVIFWYILWLGQSTYRGPAGPTGMAGGPGGGYGGGGGYPAAEPGYPPVGGYPAPPPPAAPAPPPAFPGQAPPPPGQAPPPPGQMPPLQ